jgi:phage baseplate assembly protein W
MPVTVVTRSETGRHIDTAGALGRGLVRPFRRDGASDFANTSTAELLASNLGQILGTVCSNDLTGGELPWRTEFGSLLHILRLRNNDAALAEEARAYVVDALERWEPRIELVAVAVEQDVLTDRLLIRIRWRPRTAGSEPVVIAGLETEIALG